MYIISIRALISSVITNMTDVREAAANMHLIFPTFAVTQTLINS